MLFFPEGVKCLVLNKSKAVIITFRRNFSYPQNANNTYAADFDCTDITNKEVGASLQETNQSGNSSFM